MKESVPFAKPAKEEKKDKSSKAVEKKVDTSSIFALVDENVDNYFTDGVPYFNYKIKPGDTVFGICQKFDLEMSELIKRNDLEDVEHPMIIAGKFLNITIQ